MEYLFFNHLALIWNVIKMHLKSCERSHLDRFFSSFAYVEHLKISPLLSINQILPLRGIVEDSTQIPFHQIVFIYRWIGMHVDWWRQRDVIPPLLFSAHEDGVEETSEQRDATRDEKHDAISFASRLKERMNGWIKTRTCEI